ncbi:MAG: gliding motility-associated C-terminal domain-containing protein [Flavobacteriales bacterium]|jgi:gliding motility-associated-like protein|nr:gliding motility-associated C-terminal domain-containing protein [Flavobacteriales bacterium]
MINPQAQGSIYSNEYIVIDSAATLFVEGNVQLETTNSLITNNGELIVKENWINNTDSTGLINNGRGTVKLDGDFQSISGNSITKFYQLELNGSNSVKELNNSIFVDSLLLLNDAVLETNNYIAHLLNPNQSALSWTQNGYISTNSIGGHFLRNMSPNITYVFPVGNQNLSGNHRFVEITPFNTDTNTYGVALLAESIDNVYGTSISGINGPFNSSATNESIEKLNNNYFYSIYRYSTGDSAKINFYFKSDDAPQNYTSVAQWKSSLNRWENELFTISPLSNSLPNFGNPDRIASKSAHFDFNSDIFTFIETTLFIPNGFSPDNDGINDFFVIDNLDLYENNELIIFNRWGSEIYTASPYENNWNGVSNSTDLFLQGKKIDDGTYYYILKLSDELPIMKGFLEVKTFD